MIDRKPKTVIAACAALGLGLFAAAPAVAQQANVMPRFEPRASIDSAYSTADLEEEFKKGVAALEAGEFVSAEQAFEEVLKGAPDHAQTHYYLGLSLYARDQRRKARDHFETAVKEDKFNYDARKALGVASAQMGDVDEAEKQLEALKKMRADCGRCPDGEMMQLAVDTVASVIPKG